MKFSKANKAVSTGHIAILLDKPAGIPGGVLNGEEKKYLKTCYDEKKRLVGFNQFKRWLWVYFPDGKKDINARYEDCRVNGDKVCSKLNAVKASKVQIMAVPKLKSELLAFTEGLSLGNYQFLRHKKEAEEKANSLKKADLICQAIKADDIFRLSITTNAVYACRNLVNEPVNKLNAEALAEVMMTAGKKAGIMVEVMNKSRIEALKMGGLLAVNLGSIDPPTFTVMEYKPAGAINKKPYVLVGKGVTYDTGGISLKPSNSMVEMKSDMSGAAATGMAIIAVAKAALPVWVIALIPATDNRPAGNAQVPGDIITMYDGTTVEVLNTDAEGRLILADALAYAKKYKPSLVIDMATLTGSAHAAIGKYGIVAMGSGSRKAMEALKLSGDAVHERIVEFPFWDEYKDLLKSDSADLKNIGGSYAGAITAGKFLEHFTDYPYIHLDIAGPAYNSKRDSWRGIGGSGVCVRLLFDFFLRASKK